MKNFHKSDSLLYEYDTVVDHFGSSPTFIRKVVGMHASPNVTWQDIVAEVHGVRKNTYGRYLSNSCLLTCTVERPDFVVSLSYNGCMQIVNRFIERSDLPREFAYFEAVDQLAKEMVASRDKTLTETPNNQTQESL